MATSLAVVGALYGYLLKGQVHQELGEPGEAKANFTSVLEQVIWKDDQNPDYRLHPLVQSLAERAYFRLLSFLNEEEKFEDTMRYGKEMEDWLRWAEGLP